MWFPPKLWKLIMSYVPANLPFFRLTPKDIELMLKFPHRKWNLRGVSDSKLLTLDIIEEHPHWIFDWFSMTSNKNITAKFFSINPVKIGHFIGASV